MIEKTLKESLQAFGIKQVLRMIDEDPDKTLPKLLDWVDRLDKDDRLSGQRKVFHEIIDNPDNHWYRLIKSLWTDIEQKYHSQCKGMHPSKIKMHPLASEMLPLIFFQRKCVIVLTFTFVDKKELWQTPQFSRLWPFTS